MGLSHVGTLAFDFQLAKTKALCPRRMNALAENICKAKANEATESNGLVPIGSSGNTTAENFNFGKISCGLHFFRILPLIGSFRQLFFRAKEPQSLEPSRLGSVVTNLSLASRAG